MLPPGTVRPGRDIPLEGPGHTARMGRGGCRATPEPQTAIDCRCGGAQRRLRSADRAVSQAACSGHAVPGDRRNRRSAPESPFARVAVGDADTRWGSCSSSGRIRYNWRLILAPPERAPVCRRARGRAPRPHGPWPGVQGAGDANCSSGDIERRAVIAAADREQAEADRPDAVTSAAAA